MVHKHSVYPCLVAIRVHTVCLPLVVVLNTMLSPPKVELAAHASRDCAVVLSVHWHDSHDSVTALGKSLSKLVRHIGETACLGKPSNLRRHKHNAELLLGLRSLLKSIKRRSHAILSGRGALDAILRHLPHHLLLLLLLLLRGHVSLDDNLGVIVLCILCILSLLLLHKLCGRHVPLDHHLLFHAPGAVHMARVRHVGQPRLRNLLAIQRAVACLAEVEGLSCRRVLGRRHKLVIGHHLRPFHLPTITLGLILVPETEEPPALQSER
mmetsp:Transcript_19528/g.46936  ORF Transcript_19528/g.46936 Transcript_19528/m.46936 type:complete len:267 (-) Transcript_19528:202-1002(-)